ncbi:MAG: uracil-DNA glycosylase [Candidatus Nanohalarchaeota archaeon]|nr:MAG: uracil-DNA glycosylase [Candidatus Nanohaloarchaeota archaeon]
MDKTDALLKLEDEIRNCRKCELYKSRVKPLCHGGNPDAKVMIIGEAPGYHEDLCGRPFVGKAGKVLDKLLDSVGLSRDNTFITSIVKCRPPSNKDPTGEQIRACKPFLERQMQIVRPRVIVPLGRFAGMFVFRKYNLEWKRISEVHGRVYSVESLVGSVRIVPLYHPSVALYNPDMMNVLLDDFGAVGRCMKAIDS